MSRGWISDAVTAEHIDILAVNTAADRSTETAHMSFVVEIESAEQLDHAMDRIVQALLKARHFSRTVRGMMSMPPAALLIRTTPLSFFLPCWTSMLATFLPFGVSLNGTFVV